MIMTTTSIRPPWKTPPLWEGVPVVIIGGGPSILTQDLTAIHKFRVIGTNDAYRLGDWIDVCFFGDFGWYMCTKREDGLSHREALRSFGGLKITCAHQYIEDPGILYLDRKARGIRQSPFIGWFKSTGAAAVNLAVILGASKIILVGFDMAPSLNPEAAVIERQLREKVGTWPSLKNIRLWGGCNREKYKGQRDANAEGLVNNWHLNLKDGTRRSIFAQHIKGFELLDKDLQRAKITTPIINCTPGSALDLFPKMSLEEAIK